MSKSNPPLMDSYKPASFQERGVAVPFTTPELAGARIRPAARTGTEFVVPNPSGGRGVYILHWGAVRQLCKPTVHDTLMHQRVSRLPVMDPRGVRVVARKLAAEGLAGREASIAAKAAIEADLKEQILINFLLLITLMEQTEPTGLRISATTERTPELDVRARRISANFSASINRDVNQVSADLEAISALFVPIGLDAEGPPARLPQLIGRLEAVAESLTAWSKQDTDDSFSGIAASLARSAALTARRASASLRTARDMTSDMAGLLRAWAGAPAEVAQQTSRPEWILDGWERFCLLWETSAHVSTQRAVLREMTQLVPAMPREAAEWGVEPTEPENLEPALPPARLNDNWRAGGASFSLVARNERLQALIK